MMREHPDGWGVEFTRFHGPNVVSCKIFTRHNRTSLVNAYLPPSTLKHLPDVEEELHLFKGMYPIVLGDLNVDLDESRSSRSQRVAYLITEFGIIDLVRHFRQCRRF